MLPWTSVFIFLLPVCAAQDVMKYNITLGNVSITNQEIGGVYSISIIAKNLRVPTAGQIRRFRVNVGSNSSDMDVHLQAWRFHRGNIYNLTRTKKFTKLVPGVNEVDIRWHLPAGDYIGVSCNGYCPLRRSESNPRFKSKISMSDQPIDFKKRMSEVFDDFDLMGQLAIEVVFEVTGIRPAETTAIILPSAATSTSKQTDSKISDQVPSTTTLKGIENPESQSDTTGVVGVWWILIIACVLVVLLAVALVIVGACSWRRERGTLKKQLLNSQSRPTSTSSETDGPLPAGGSNFNTLSRDNRGLQSLHEIEILNERREADHHGGNLDPVVASVSPPAERPVGEGRVTVTFDNGHNNDSIILPPPPPMNLPPNEL